MIWGTVNPLIIRLPTMLNKIMKYFVKIISFIFLSFVFIFCQNDIVLAQKTSISAVPKKTAAVKNEKVVLADTVLTAKNKLVLTVTKDGKTYEVTTDARTLLRRRYFGKATLDEMQVNDNLYIIGTYSDTEKTKIIAKLVRDVSIQKKQAVIIGTVKSVANDSFVINTISKKGVDQTIQVTKTTRYINRKGSAITKDKILVDHKIRVKGVWDSTSNTFSQVTQIKDFSIPPIPTPTVKPNL
jgi:hypothetical protein